MPDYNFHHLPPSLQDVVARMLAGQSVYGFELELLADFVST